MLEYLGPGSLVLAKGQVPFVVDGKRSLGHLPEHVCGYVIGGKRFRLQRKEMVFTSDGSLVYDEHGRPRRLLNGLCLD